MKKNFLINSLKIIIFIAIFLFSKEYLVAATSFLDDVETSYQQLETIAHDEISHEDYFIMLFLGKDADEIVERSDSIIILAINFQTKDSILLSIPRDTYIPISCLDDRKDKITHAFTYGNKCTINSLATFLDIEFNYIVEMSFNGFISVIDYFGTISMDVPNLNNGYTWCEQDSNNTKNKICFEKFGVQDVTSEQALALARTRKYDSDFSRGKRQLEIINGTLDELSNSSVLEMKNVTELLINLNGDLNTNISLPSAFKIAYDIKTSDINLTSSLLQIQGEDINFKGENSSIIRYYFIPDETQINEIKESIKKLKE